MKVFVTGATGKAGRRMVERLAAAGVAVRAGSRHPGGAAPAITPVLFDWYDKATWKPALGDADVLVVKGLDLDDYAFETVDQLIASRPSVQRVVFLSNPGVELLPDDHPRRAIELVVQNSGKDWTVLRSNWFMQNFDEDRRVFADALRTNGELHAPAGDAKISFVDTRDIADALAAVLADDMHAGRAYTLTGPEAVSFGEVTQAIGKAASRTIRHVDGSLAEHRDHMRGPDRTAAYANHINHLFVIARTGVQAAISDDVRTLTGHPPRTLQDYIDQTWARPENRHTVNHAHAAS